MADFLIVQGFVVPVAIGGAQRLESRLVGDLMQTFSGGTRSGIRGRVRGWRFTTIQLAPADARTLWFALTARATVTASGEAFDGETVTARATVKDAGYLPSAGEIDRAVTFELWETTPYSPVLFSYLPGDLGYTFSRASVASYRSQAGVITSAASGALRDSHYVLNADGVYERATLIERERTNGFTASEDLSNAAWVKTNVTVTANDAVAPDGETTADKLVSVAENASMLVGQSMDVVSGTAYTLSIYAKADEWTFVQITGSTGFPSSWRNFNLSTGAAGNGDIASTAYRITAAGGGWYRIEVTLTAASSVSGRFVVAILNSDVGSRLPGLIGDAASGLHVWGAQWEEGETRSSYIPTTTAAVTRAEDSLSFPFTGAPQAMTVYARFVESGSIKATFGSRRVFVIAGVGTGSPWLICDASALGYRVRHNNGESTSLSSSAVAPSLGDLVELRSILGADGSVQIAQTLNGGTEVVATASAETEFAAAWSGELFWLGGDGALAGLTAFTHAVILKGECSLAECRAAVGVL